MGILTRESLLAKEQLEIVKVDLGDGQHVYVRQMTGRERDSFERTIVEVHTPANPGEQPLVIQRQEDFRAKLAVHTICDAQGQLLLKPEDYETLSTNISAKRLDRIAQVAQSLNVFTEEVKADLLKN